MSLMKAQGALAGRKALLFFSEGLPIPPSLEEAYRSAISEANRANVAKGPAGTNGSRLRAALATRGLRLPLLGEDDATADRNYIKEFVLTRNRELGRQYGVEYAEVGRVAHGREPRTARGRRT